MGFLKTLFPSKNERDIAQLEKIADKIEALSETYSKMSDDELKGCTQKFKDQLNNGKTLDDLLPDAFAVVREASARVLKMRHFYVQLLGGIVLHQGRIAEMKTGEGKTLVATLPAYLNALTGKGVQIVTVNDYLAQRDAEWMGKIYKFLGLTVGVNISQMEHDLKQQAYNCDILYATNNELGFDYLRDNMVVRKADKVQRELNFAIIDEVDSILIDEARTPLIISGASNKSSEMYVSANRFAKTLKKDEDFEIDEKDKTIRLLDSGIAKAESFFKVENIGDIENTDLNHHIHMALKAQHIMKKDSDYIVNDGEIIIVDEFTGRMMIGRRYSEGLHQAIEAKEGVRIQNENKTFATITFQNYFRLYKKLSGMTGTAKTEEEEFKGIYALDVVELPTNEPMIRKDENDQLYKTKNGKMNAIVNDIKSCYEKGQPVLVGTITVEKSEELSNILKKMKIPHNVLNAKNHEKEAEIIAQAGKLKQVTIATNMAGRGTDIMLGGNPEYLAKNKLVNLGYSHDLILQATSFAPSSDEAVKKAKEDYDHYYKLFKEETEKEKEKVIENGGLRIVGTERHESRRIDNQLRGRSGRQGDPGSTIFYISMEDDIARIFGGDRLYAIADRLNLDENVPIANKIITGQIEKAQRMIENRNYSVRKHVLSYDDVMNAQRDVIYAERKKVLENCDVHNEITNMIEFLVEDITDYFLTPKNDFTSWDFEACNNALNDRIFTEETEILTEEVVQNNPYKTILQMIKDKALEQYQKKADEIKEKGLDFGELERVILLRTVDTQWIDHIDAMDMLRKGIGLRAYGQDDPVIAYKREGYEMFDDMIFRIKKETVRTLMKMTVENKLERKSAVENKNLQTNDVVRPSTIRKEKTVGRNEPCPCGSGKKYKYCCMEKDNQNNNK